MSNQHRRERSEGTTCDLPQPRIIDRGLIKALAGGGILALALVSILGLLGATNQPVAASSGALPVATPRSSSPTPDPFVEREDLPLPPDWIRQSISPEAPYSTLQGFVVLLSAETQDPAGMYNGERVTYTIVLDNQSPVMLTGISTTDLLPRNTLDKLECSHDCELIDEENEIPEPSGGTIVVVSTREISWSIPSLAAGDRITRVFSGRVIGQPDGATVTNRAFVTYNGGETARSNELQLVSHVRIDSDGGASVSSVPTWFSEDLGGTISQDWGDFDRDGDLDLALGSSLGTSVYGNENGRLTLLFTNIPPPSSPPEDRRLSYGVSWADVDQDPQQLELVVVGHSADRTAISEGLNYIYAYDPAQSGQPFVETAVFTSQYQLVRVAPGDYDGDGDIDLIASTNAINAPGLCPVTLYRNDSTGHFTGTVTSKGGHEIECLSKDGTAALGAGDYDNDGDLDLVVGAFPGALRLLVNLCDGQTITDTNPFAKAPHDLETVLEYIPYDLDWSDFDGDGFLDLAAAYPLQREVRIYRNQPGAGPVALPRPLRTAPFMTPLTVDWGDFDRDGRLDLAVADSPPKIYQYDEATGEFSWISSLQLSPRLGQIWSLRGVELKNNGNLDLSMSNRDGASHIFANFSSRLSPRMTPVGPLRPWSDSSGRDWASDVAWGDADGDGDLDLLFGSGSPPVLSSYLLVNDDGDFSTRREFLPSGFGPHRVAFGDLTRNGLLDVAIGTPDVLQVYLSGVFNAASWEVTTLQAFHSLAWGDANDDGRLDLLAGKEDGSICLYLNQGTQLAQTPAFTATMTGDVHSLAWGDFDGDYYLDFAAAADGAPVHVYRNNGDASFSLAWESAFPVPARALGWADYDADGDLDLAVGNYGAADWVWENAGATFSVVWTSTTPLSRTTSLAWGDWDSDGYPELAVGKDGEPDVVYANLGSAPGAPQLVALWNSAEVSATTGVAWGDLDNDGDLDLAASHQSGGRSMRNGYYENGIAVPAHLAGAFNAATPFPNNPPYLHVERPGPTADGYLYSSPAVVAGPGQPTVTIKYRLHDPEADLVAQTYFEYSLSGGSRWQPATPAGSAPLTLTSPAGEQGTFIWDAFADVGISDNARFRIRVVPQDSIGPVQRGSSSAVSPPFRVRALYCSWPAGISITSSPEHPEPGDTAHFTAHVASAGGGINTYWDFGDGTPEVEGWNVSHQYNAHGAFTVILRVEGPACPIARPGYARKLVIVGVGALDQVIYLPLVLRSFLPVALDATNAPIYESTDLQPPTSNLQLSISNFQLPTSNFQPPTSDLPDTSAAPLADTSVQVTRYALGVNSQPAVNRDGSRIAFWSTSRLPDRLNAGENDDGSIEIFVAEVDKASDAVKYTQITSSTGSILGGFNLHPSIDDVGSRIAFFSDRDLVGLNRDHNFEIFVAEVLTTPETVVITQVTGTPKGINILPDISGDGRFVAFASDRDLTGTGAQIDGQTEVFRAEVVRTGTVTISWYITTTRITTITGDTGINDQPSINQDGEFIALVSDQDLEGNGENASGNRQAFLARVGPGSQITYTQVTTSVTGVHDQPSISADGSRIAFVSTGNDPQGTRQVYVADILTPTLTVTRVTQVTSNAGDKDQPNISADGTRIAYVWVRGANDRRLCLYDDVEKGEPKCVEGNNAYPALGPDGTDVAFVRDWKVLLINYPLADLSVSKSADQDEVEAEDTLNYAIVVTNNGPSPATDLTLQDVLPPGVVVNLPAALDYTDDSQGEFEAPSTQRVYTEWDDVNKWLEMSTSITNPFYLPDNGGDADGWMNMDGNQLLLHLDGNLLDTSGRGNPGVCSSCPAQGVSGKLGTAAEFFGDQYVTLPSAGVLGLPYSDFTAMAWINISAFSGDSDETVFGTDQTGLYSQGLHLVIRNRKPYMGFYANDTAGRTPLTEGTWYHVVWRYRVYAGWYPIWEQAIFVNGQLDTSTGGHYPFIGSGPVHIGRWANNYYFNGKIDEAAIFSRALTDAEIEAIYRRQAPEYGAYFDSRVMKLAGTLGSRAWSSIEWVPHRIVGKELPDDNNSETSYPTGTLGVADMSNNVLLLHLNESSGSSFRDTSSYENDAFCSGGDCPVVGSRGRFDRGLWFDRDSSDYIYTLSDPSLDLSGGEFTEAAWIYPAATSFSYHGILGFHPTGGSAERYPSLWVYDYDSIHAGFGDGTIWNSFIVDHVLTPKAWNHVAATFDGTDYAVYVNGDLEYSTDAFSDTKPYSGTTQVTIGKVDNHFNGLIDEVAIFNRALSASEIKDHYLRGALRMQFQARSCDDAGCNIEPFVGPDGTQGTYYEPIGSMLTPPAFALNVPDNQYIQYRAYMDTDDAGYSPELKSVTVEPRIACSGLTTITCSLSTQIAPLNPGQSLMVTLPVTVTASAYDGAVILNDKSVILNTATVDSAESDHGPIDNVAQVSTTMPITVLTGVTITGPTVGDVDANHSFDAQVLPGNAAPPVVRYTWEATDQITVYHKSKLTDTVTFSWSTPGVKVITVTADSSFGNVVSVVSDVHTITVQEVTIAGLAAYNDGPTTIGTVTTLSATITAGSNVTYTWAFGDGGTDTGSVVTHYYPSVGVYTAIVTASNSVGWVTATTTVTITDVPITGLAAHNDSPTTIGNDTTLSATITAGTNVVYTWDFDDGDTGTGRVVTHRYLVTRTYTAVVTASNSANLVTATTSVSVITTMRRTSADLSSSIGTWNAVYPDRRLLAYLPPVIRSRR
jgi:uncharacterized repeat protein (TIGR01451 family)